MVASVGGRALEGEPAAQLAVAVAGGMLCRVVALANRNAGRWVVGVSPSAVACWGHRVGGCLLDARAHQASGDSPSTFGSGCAARPAAARGVDPGWCWLDALHCAQHLPAVVRSGGGARKRTLSS